MAKISENKFLKGLMAALENQEPTDDLLNGVSDAGDPDLDPQEEAINSPSGNPGSPGDDNGNPVGHDDPDRDAGQAELPSEDAADDDSGNPPSPGDAAGNPDPDNACGAGECCEESFLDGLIAASGGIQRNASQFGFGAATEGIKDLMAGWTTGTRRDAGMAVAQGFNRELTKNDQVTDDMINAAVKGYLEWKTKLPAQSTPETQEKAKSAVSEWNDKHMVEETGLTLKYKKCSGMDCVLTYENGNFVDMNVFIPGQKKGHLIDKAWVIKLSKKQANASESTVFGLRGRAARLAMETEIDTNEPGGFPDTLDGFSKEVALHKNRNEILLQQQKDADDESGNTGDPADNKQTPVTPSGDTKVVHLDQAIIDSYDESGNTGDPTGDGNGSPVSKSGDSKPVGRNDFEKDADDDSGNPDGPGVEGDPAPSFETFISACEQMKISRDAATVIIPESMSLEAYALELGYGEIASRAMEARLTAAERRNLKDSDFALPSERKWPIHDPDHVRSAIQNFHWAPKDKQKEIAGNILKAMRKFKMKKVQVSEGNPFLQYYSDAVVIPRKKPTRKPKG